MTQDEIIEMAKQFCPYQSEEFCNAYYDGFMKASKLVAQHEREACAVIAEKQRYAMHISLTSNPPQNGTAVGIANAIRAREQA